MSRTNNFLIQSIAALCFFAATQAMAALPNQPFRDPATIPADTDYGAFATVASVDSGSGTFFDDTERAVAWDNFTLTDAYNIDGICWTGIYAEGIPTGAVSETDFIIRIYPDDGSAAPGAPDLAAATTYMWSLDGGLAGESGPDVTVTGPLGHVSPVTGSNPIGGGDAYSYEASLTTMEIPAGDYWISITAAQEFDTPGVFDPEWMWHLGEGTDGFYGWDGQFPVGTDDIGEFFDDKNLAFELKGSIVPEPSSMLLALCGVLGLGMIRRKRS